MTDPYDAYEALKPKRATIYLCQQKHQFGKWPRELGIILAEDMFQAKQCNIGQHESHEWDPPQYDEIGEIAMIGELPQGFKY